MCDYRVYPNTTLSRNQRMDGALEVGQSLEIEFYFTVQSTYCDDPGGFCSILHIGASWLESTPGIWVSTSGQFIVNMIDSEGIKNHGFTIGEPGLGSFEYGNLADGRRHIFYLKFTFTQMSVEIDNVRAYTAVGSFFNTDVWSEYPIYLGDPWYNAALWTVSDLCLYSDAPTPQPTNAPTFSPTKGPSDAPTTPTQPPTLRPSTGPTKAPTPSPTTRPTLEPTGPTLEPTPGSPTAETLSPTEQPTIVPTDNPTFRPTMPTKAPTTGRPTTYEPTHPWNIVGEWPPDDGSPPDVDDDDAVFGFVSGGEMNTNSYLFFSGIALSGVCCFGICIYRRRRALEKQTSMFSSIENGHKVQMPVDPEIAAELPHSLVHNASISMRQQSVVAADHPQGKGGGKGHHEKQHRKDRRERKKQKRKVLEH